MGLRYYLLLLPILTIITPAVGHFDDENGMNYYLDSVSWKVRSTDGDDEKQLLLTIDDTPNPASTGKFLSLLEKHEVPAIFFMNGFQSEDVLSEEIGAILEAGHEVANHTWEHSRLTTLDRDGVAEDIGRVNEWLAAEMDYEPRFFRPPYGASSPGIERKVQEAGLKNMGWSVNSYDWHYEDDEDSLEEHAREIKERTLAGLEDGGILLLHDRPVSLRALELLLPAVEELGYRWVVPD